MAAQAGHGDGTGSTPGPDPLPTAGAPGPVPLPHGGMPEPGTVPLPPRGAPGVPAAGPAGPDGAPDPAGFAAGGQWDACAPSAALAVAAEAAAGPGWACDGLNRDELTGLLRSWQALESWAAAGKLGVLRALIREEDQPLPGGSYRAGLPEGWTKSLTHEVAAALAMSVTSAENLMWLAFDLHARLPGTGQLLAAGALTLPKARAIDQALTPLTDEDAAAAEAMIVPELPGKTHSRAAGLAAQAAITVDPESAARRREEAERSRSRVLTFREESGAAALSGRDLPTGQALAAHARVCERAAEYHDSGVFGEARTDQLRATAYLDLINGTTAHARITAGHLAAGPDSGTASTRPGTADSCDTAGPRGGGLDRSITGDEPGSDDTGGDNPDGGGPCDGGPPGGGPPDGGLPGGGSSDDGPPDGGLPGGGSPDDGSPDDGPPGSGAAGPSSSPPRLADLVLPLATLLGLAERPGEGHGLGPLDPELCRDLAGAATASPWTRLCVTVTNSEGIAIGHGCARPTGHRKSPANAGNAGPGCATGLPLPARVQLTITATLLEELGRAVRPPGRSAWHFTCDDAQGPPGGLGRWALALPDGRSLRVLLEPMPTFDCDHRHETHAYQPGDTLRHLVQVRDGECTFPPCSRHARDTDFEHATPYDKGGRTCACNAGARSRQCHRVKQSPGWNVTQPKPGWHEWTTPAGRSYTQGPKRYPV